MSVALTSLALVFRDRGRPLRSELLQSARRQLQAGDGHQPLGEGGGGGGGGRGLVRALVRESHRDHPGGGVVLRQRGQRGGGGAGVEDDLHLLALGDAHLAGILGRELLDDPRAITAL